MAKANPKAWFTSPIAKITYSKVDKYARMNERWRPFFPTWTEAHRWMIDKACERVRLAERELKSARAHLGKVMAMTAPAAAAVIENTSNKE